MLQDICCLFSPNLQVSKSPNAGYHLSFFLIVFMDESMIPVKLITPVCQGLILAQVQ